MLKPLLMLTGFSLAATVSGTAQQPHIPKKDSSKREPVFSRVDQMPEFEGNPSLFIFEHLRIPDTLPEDAFLGGKIIVRFTVNQQGKVTHPKIEQGMHPILDKEVLRIIRLMPRWKPAVKNGKLISTELTLPIRIEGE